MSPATQAYLAACTRLGAGELTDGVQGLGRWDELSAECEADLYRDQDDEVTTGETAA